MIYACILYAPAPTDPNKSRFREVLGAFPSTGNRHPLSHQNNKIVSGAISFSSAAAGRAPLEGVPPTANKGWLSTRAATFGAFEPTLVPSFQPQGQSESSSPAATGGG